MLLKPIEVLAESFAKHREETLDNEKATNGTLIGLSERFINKKAVSE